MQLTRLDRWLREKFVHETHIYTLRAAENVPPGVMAEEIPEAPGKKFRHRYIARSNGDIALLIEDLKAHNQMFTTRVVDRTGWHIQLIAPEGKSAIWFCIWVIVGGIGLFFATTVLRTIWANPEFQKNFHEAIEILKG